MLKEVCSMIDLNGRSSSSISPQEICNICSVKPFIYLIKQRFYDGILSGSGNGQEERRKAW
jgi:hypothetical protein